MDTAIQQQEQQAPMRRVVAAMNREDWAGAQNEIRAILRVNSSDSNAHLHKAICHFRAGMAKMESDPRAAAAEFTDGRTALHQAEKHCSWRDWQMKSAIADLKKKVGL